MLHCLLSLLLFLCGGQICSIRNSIELRYCLDTRCTNGFQTVMVNAIGAAITPNAIAKGSRITQQQMQQQQLLSSLARKHGAAIIAPSIENTAPKAQRMMKPKISRGNRRPSPSTTKKAFPFDTSSTSRKKRRCSSPSTH